MSRRPDAEVGKEASDGALREALDRLAEPGCGALSLPFLAPGEIAPLLAEARTLPYRPARPLVGEAERAVAQDFELTEQVPAGGAIADLARALERRLLRLQGPWLEPDFTLNDLIAQRYPAGSRGITPHRDHLRYRSLVVLTTLVGAARLFLCADRAGSAAAEIDIAPGRLVLMRAPGYAGQAERPFHFLKEVASERISLGLRHDTRPA